MLKRNRYLLALATSVTGLAMLAPSAQATPPITVPPDPPYNDDYDFACDAGTPDDPSDDFTAHENHVGAGVLSLKVRKSVPDFYFGTFRGYDDGTFTAALPNGTTARWTSHNDYIEKDRRILSIEGDIATVLVGTTFHSNIFAPDGTRDSTSVGMFQFTIKVNLVTQEGEFGEVIRDVGHRGIGTLCGDAMRFALG